MNTERGPPHAGDPPTYRNARPHDQIFTCDDKDPNMKTFLEAAEISDDSVFVKSRRSGAAGHCVEIATVDGGVALRHSKAPGQGAFLFSGEEMTAFVQGAKDGDFDHLIA